jgi:anti-anti-sigma factor
VAELDRAAYAVPGQLEIAVRQGGATTTIALSGELDLAGQAATGQAIQSALAPCPEWVVLDLSQLSFIDVSGMRVILELHKRSIQQYVHLVIVPGPRSVQRPF